MQQDLERYYEEQLGRMRETISRLTRELEEARAAKGAQEDASMESEDRQALAAQQKREAQIEAEWSRVYARIRKHARATVETWTAPFRWGEVRLADFVDEFLDTQDAFWRTLDSTPEVDCAEVLEDVLADLLVLPTMDLTITAKRARRVWTVQIQRVHAWTPAEPPTGTSDDLQAALLDACHRATLALAS